jgi:hypothetical protein
MALDVRKEFFDIRLYLVSQNHLLGRITLKEDVTIEV